MIDAGTSGLPPIDKERWLLVPKQLPAVTRTLPEVNAADKLMVIVLVPAPDVIVPPAGTVQL